METRTVLKLQTTHAVQLIASSGMSDSGETYLSIGIVPDKHNLQHNITHNATYMASSLT